MTILGPDCILGKNEQLLTDQETIDGERLMDAML